MRIFEQLESEVRGYVRSFPVMFDTAKGSLLYDEQGNEYIDFFAGAGTLNYGHNNPIISKALLKYIERDGIMHGLDKATVAKRTFLQKFYDTILSPRNLEYKVQFTGPTGTNAVETALKLARMIKRRSNVIAFTNGYHGLTMGSLAVTGNTFYRDESYGIRNNSAFMPFDGYFGPDVDTIEYFRRFLEDASSGVDLPAAVILETVQAEGGINVASNEWLQQLEQLCREFDILLIIDDIQVGNGRTGTFFSFERAGITPDMVTLSKSIGGGLPLALLLMRPELDQWQPGEHTGTFRGNNLAFVAAAESLAYWDNDDLAEAVKYKGEIMETELNSIAEKYPELNAKVRGVGMIWGLELPRNGFSSEVSKKAFENGLVIELAGAEDQVVKFLPSLTIDEKMLRQGLAIIDKSIGDLLAHKREMRTGDTQGSTQGGAQDNETLVRFKSA
ncbi:diaminobutyrate/2-oxoglutarate aminotransferase [Nitrosococcus halophilus Nc 4]|uniref:Diaminobutyrate--2-oxoglutarate transaminase n=1 Tax=Nitrosococcus halophilus (strain Nc4) TaxID=472759 RepID=D5BX99_NITHN|nr:diaminobutyrate--2-oxoglutarate transaminase [Nitrosococcus halophilus]ADE15782.1 diaminobutyrate/2-oxoglutarate aminotransferase [Nitrosococcus halophilus Nc 4]